MVVVSAAALGSAVPAVAARPPVHTCRESNGPFGEDRQPIGTIAAVVFVSAYADPGFFATRRQKGSRPRYWAKAPLAVRRGKFVTIGIARKDRDVAELVAGTQEADSLRFKGCPGRSWTSWAGGFRLKHAACVHVVARERGSRHVHRTTLSFGMGDSCG